MMSKRRTPDPLDVLTGQRLRAARLQSRRTQEELAQALGLTFQQIQKYEMGRNRIAPSRLLVAAQFLGCRMADILPPEDEDTDALTDELARLRSDKRALEAARILVELVGTPYMPVALEFMRALRSAAQPIGDRAQKAGVV